MPRTIEAVGDEDGTVRLLEAVTLQVGQRVLVTVLDEAGAEANEAALLSEHALAADWNRPEEDEAWAHLQRER
jgi:predicted DNA-binding antitoxin AbrB/MazE fold protein